MKNAIIGFLVVIIIALGVLCTLLVTGKIDIKKTNNGGKTEEKDTKKVTDYSGTYKNDDSSEIVIIKDGDSYNVNIGIYRLASFENGKVTDIKDDILTISSTDPSGNPITFTFNYKTKVLTVKESTWDLLKVDETFEFNK